MHTLYMIYDNNGKVTGFVIDDVSTTQNFISLDRGPLSYIQSIIDNLNAYIKKNGSLTVDNVYLGQVRHGHFDTTYGEIEDKRTNNSQYTFKSSTSAHTSSSTQPAAKPEQTTSAASQAQKPTSSAASTSAAATNTTSAATSAASSK